MIVRRLVVAALFVSSTACVKRVVTVPPEAFVTLGGQRASYRDWSRVGDLCAIDPKLVQQDFESMSVLLANFLGQTSAGPDGVWAEEHIALHSGNGSGTTDSQVRLLPVIPGVPLTAANFAAACASATFATQTGAPSNACTNVGAGSWLMNPGYGTLYAHPFEIKACNITSLRIKGRGAVWGFLGDALGNPNVGIYVNGKPIRGSVAAGNGGTACLGGEVVIGGCDLVTGTNCICFYLRDVVSPIAPMTGLVYDLQMTVRSCA